MDRSTRTTVFNGKFDTSPIQYRHIEHMHEGVWLKKIRFDKMTAVRTSTIFPLLGFCVCFDGAFMG